MLFTLFTVLLLHCSYCSIHDFRVAPHVQVVVIEINATMDSLYATFSVPVGAQTRIIKTADAKYTLVELAGWRVLGRVVVSTIRLVVSGFMLVAGSAPAWWPASRWRHVAANPFCFLIYI